ncbi:MAG: lysophospholipid acyltransferase family protein [Bacteroidia bacterium]
MIPLLLFAYLCVAWMPDRQRTLTMYRMNRMMLGFWFFISGFTLKIEGEELIDPQATYVFAGNHVNMLDVPMAGYVLMHYFKPIVKQETRDLFLLGYLFRILGIPVDRTNATQRSQVYQQMAEALKKGISIALLPEGTRNRTDLPLLPFKNGAFRAAIEAQVPIVPMVFLDIRELQADVDAWRAVPGKMRFKYLPPIPTAGMTQDDADELKKKVFTQIYEVLVTEDSFCKNWKGKIEDLQMDFPNP